MTYAWHALFSLRSIHHPYILPFLLLCSREAQFLKDYNIVCKFRGNCPLAICHVVGRWPWYRVKGEVRTLSVGFTWLHVKCQLRFLSRSIFRNAAVICDLLRHSCLTVTKRAVTCLSINNVSSTHRVLAFNTPAHSATIACPKWPATLGSRSPATGFRWPWLGSPPARRETSFPSSLAYAGYPVCVPPLLLQLFVTIF
jgi:hypothetical protein